MEETLVGLRVADLADQAGFCWHCRYVITGSGSFSAFAVTGELKASMWQLKNLDEYRNHGRVLLCPSQALLCQWLREAMGIFLHVERRNGKFYFVSVSGTQTGLGYTGHDTYEFAMEDGLNYVLLSNKKD